MKRTWRRACEAVCVALLLSAGGPGQAPASEPPAALASEPSDAATLLRQARAARDGGREAEARQRLERLIEEHALVADYAALFTVEGLLAAGENRAAAAYLAGARRRYADSSLAVEFAILEGDAQAAVGDEAAARSAWQAATSAFPRRDAARAPLMLAIADSLARQGQREEARRAYSDIWKLYPLEPEAEPAARWLEADAAAGGPPRSADLWRQRGNRLYRLRDDNAALAAYERALELGPSARARAQIRRARAELLFRQRRYDEAVEAYAALPQTADVPVSTARAIARAGRVPEAIDALVAFVERHPNGKQAHRARYIAALLLIGEDRDEEARGLLELVASKTGSTGMRWGALWQLGWDDYRAGRYRRAARRFDALAANYRSELDALRPRYWKARALERVGDPNAAIAFAEIAAEFPLSYYGWRAAQRLAEDAASTPAKRPPARRWSAPTLREDHAERVRILLEAGLTREANRELEWLAARARHPEDRLRLASLFRAVGNYNRAQGESMRIGTAELARGPERHREEFWWHAWPRAFGPDVRAAAAEQEGAVDSDLVLAVIREESGYRPKVVSGVGARGLMQLMEPTAREIAEERGDHLEADDLFEPGTNIRLGTHYLAELGETFPESPAAAIASYNAGPQIVATWPGLGELAEDEWVEEIPYDQTQKYVKRVLRSQHAYESLYGND